MTSAARHHRPGFVALVRGLVSLVALPGLVLCSVPCACSSMLDLPTDRMFSADDAGTVDEPDSGEGPRDAGQNVPDARFDLVCEYVPCTTGCGGAGRQMCFDESCGQVGRCKPTGEDCETWGDQSCLPFQGSGRDSDDPCCRVPENDRCDSARDIGQGSIAGGCTQSASNDEGDPGVPSAGPDVFFLWSLAVRSRVTFSLLQATFDTVLYVRTTCGDPATTLGSNDDSAATCADGADTSELTLDLDPGAYYVVVDSPGAEDWGYFRMNIGTVPL